MVVGQELPPPSEVNDLLASAFALLAVAGALTFGVGLALRAPMEVYGGGLALCLLSLAIGVRRYFAAAYPDIEALEPRVLPQHESDIALSEVESAASPTLPRRLLLAAAGLLGLSFAVPVSSLGPAPGDALRRTVWSSGTRLVSTDGRPLKPEDVVAGGVATVWPEGAIRAEDASVVLVRLGVPPQPPTVLDWVVNGELVAYSKVCTHAGCPVGLFRERDNALFCPCHQSTFDASQGAKPTFGPAARALPQLPLGVNDRGYLIALGDFQEQVGPAFG